MKPELWMSSSCFAHNWANTFKRTLDKIDEELIVTRDCNGSEVVDIKKAIKIVNKVSHI